MKYIVFSDSHGRKSFMEKALDKEKFDGVIHLGDGYSDLDDIEARYPYKAFIRVTGNCDYSYLGPAENIASTDGVCFLACHGHTHGVKGLSKASLALYAKAKGVKLALFGHTHSQFLETVCGVLLLNPGSIQTGYYALLSLKDGKATAELKEIE